MHPRPLRRGCRAITEPGLIVMRFRSLVLFACMIVVPLLAMFSHRISPELRSTVRSRLWEPARQAIAGAFDIETPTRPAAVRLDAVPASPGPAVTIAVAPSSAPTPAEPRAAGDGGSAAPSMVVMPTVKLAAVDAIATPAAAAGGGLSVPASTATAAGLDRPQPEPDRTSASLAGSRIPPEPPAMPSPPAERPDREPPSAADSARSLESEIRVRRAVEERLAALGAISFDCQPLQGTDGIHRCSCRVAADPTGQLQRVFQSSGPDPVSAMSTLLDQVTAWKQRIASRPDQPPAATGVRF